MMKKMPHIWTGFHERLRSINLLGTSLDDILVKFLFAAVLMSTIVWMLPSERPFQYGNLNVGSIAREEIIAPFKFPIQKSAEELEQQREAARLSVPRVFVRIDDTQRIQELTLNRLFDDLGRFLSGPNAGLLKGITIDTPVDAVPAPVDSFLAEFNLRYNTRIYPSILASLAAVNDPRSLIKLQQQLFKAVDAVYERGIIDLNREAVVEQRIAIVDNGVETDTTLEDITDIKSARSDIYRSLEGGYAQGSIHLEIADQVINAFLHPNLKYNEIETLARKESAVHLVPLTRGYVEQDERIIDSNEKVSDDVYRKLQSLSLALQERSALQGGLDNIKFVLGKWLFVIALLVLTVLYIYFYRPDIFYNNWLLGMITIIFMMQLGTVMLVVNVLEWPAISIPIILAPMLLAMLLDFGIAFICTVTLGLILGAILSNDFTFTFMTLIVGSVAIFSVQKIRNRAHIFRAIFFIMIAYLFENLILGLTLFYPVSKIFTDFLYSLLPNATIVPAIVFILIGVFERFFDVTTDITLLELSDLNHPLLKKLSVKAPGTFHHSNMVANLGESAAEKINANALLTRVGCYFHDVGKMLKPEYFVENQMGGINKHDSLSPHMSCLILANHVKEGLKLARQHNLPNAVKQFIAEHHGTSLMIYFYHKALENSDPKEINEIDFRYPGPRPQSPETAIAMLADTVEAASRTLQEPTPQRIRNLVDSLIDKKIKEGQLDECRLTLQDINQIKEAFIPILTGIHHLRIDYPDTDPVKKSAKADGESSVKQSGKTKSHDAAQDGDKSAGQPANLENGSHDHAD